ncbi:MAG: TetR/AcrR family transcriptional regulator [Tenericutes bacterium]|nr:TetR/AcrR family transcriptional regulator [Mycoplasmatota bacterium]
MTQLSYGGGSIPKQTFFNLDTDKQNRIVSCALDEFAERSFDNSNLSNIIKNAQIPRGSLYQYFKDKTDLYMYVMEITKNKKLEYIQEFFVNPMDLPFFELFKSMYKSGIKFALENPKMVKMFSHLLASKGTIYDLVFKENLHIALDMYSVFIDRDKEQGRIRKDIDTKVLAQLVIDMTVNVTVNEVSDGKFDLDYENMTERIAQIMKIFEHGVVAGK